jgi:hypothetical protein
MARGPKKRVAPAYTSLVNAKARSAFQNEKDKTNMNPVTEVKTNSSPAVICKTTARDLAPSTFPSFSFPIHFQGRQTL